MENTPTETTPHNINTNCMSFYFSDCDRVTIERVRQMARDQDRSISWVMLDLIKKALG